MKVYQDKVIIAVDTGYGNIKTANHYFRTGIMAYDSEPLFTKDMLVYDGKYYLIGEGHKEFLPEKQLDEDYFLLTLVAIAKELKTAGTTEADVILAVGLPLTWMTGQKEAFRSYLLRDGDIYFTYRKVDYTVRICDVRVYPQGYAAIASFASELTGVNMIADIGNGTMNVLYIVNSNPLSGKMYTEKFGTYQCTLAIREEFMRKTRRELNDAIIDEILVNGTADIAKDDLKLIKATAVAYVADIFRRLREHGYDENTMKLYLTGGGACLVKHFYKVNKDRVTFVDDICAAAKGYEYMADIQLRTADHA